MAKGDLLLDRMRHQHRRFRRRCVERRHRVLSLRSSSFRIELRKDFRSNSKISRTIRTPNCEKDEIPIEGDDLYKRKALSRIANKSLKGIETKSALSLLKYIKTYLLEIQFVWRILHSLSSCLSSAAAFSSNSNRVLRRTEKPLSSDEVSERRSSIAKAWFRKRRNARRPTVRRFVWSQVAMTSLAATSKPAKEVKIRRTMLFGGESSFFSAEKFVFV